MDVKDIKQKLEEASAKVNSVLKLTEADVDIEKEYNLDEESKKIMVALFKFVGILAYYELQVSVKVNFYIVNGIDTPELDSNLKNIKNSLIDLAQNLFSFLKEAEDKHGGGYMDTGILKVMRLISEGDLSKSNLESFTQDYRKIIPKLVLFNANKRVKEESDKVIEIQSQCSDKKGKAA